MFPFEHEPDCKPFFPCLSCRARDFLKENLSPEKFEDFTDLAKMYRRRQLMLADREILPLEKLGLSRVTQKLLMKGGINNTTELLRKTKTDLFRIRGIGINRAREVQTGLEKSGFALKG